MSQVFSTCDLCDQYKSDESGAFRVLPPLYKNFGAVEYFSGAVATVKCFEDNTLVKAAVESSGNGRVLVVDGGGSMRKALVGGNLARAATENGWAGIVVDGCVRDVDELITFKVGIKAFAAMPMPTIKRKEGQSDVPVLLHGSWIRPGDWLVSDRDGIVILESKPD